MTIPAQMSAAFAARPGGPEVLEIRSVPVPQPAAGEVLIAVEAAGINRPDAKQRAGNYAPPPGVTQILGLEVAGRIVGCGPGVDDAMMGTDVCALVAGGGYAQYCTAPVPQLLPKPERLSWTEAAALPETTFTVWANLFDIGRLKMGERVLIHGGTSGIGTTAIQLAKAAGCWVATTAGSQHKVERAREIGADLAIDYRQDDFCQAVLNATKGEGVHAILDLVCADYMDRNLRCLADDGRLIVVSFLGGAVGSVDFQTLAKRRQTICGSTLRPRSITDKGRLAQEIRTHVWPLVERGLYVPVINSVHPLENVRDAHQEMEDGRHVGKIVLSVKP
ncbi:NAD(P)H-quinone oxidoreductase [Jiella pelagia]|uniref:NAD(P)H-quinone oxidoreductase n=1 Tax=Jiella pelagia TaxID=2986949 RepID=A0ABY7BWQ9_9HYPH|nr:NAD(P)H-quinone oxidoreductase [Jiella pelagia]WAP67857.1 NAD(P)H-quinone oxidoreductase [Jiella pelagia]